MTSNSSNLNLNATNQQNIVLNQQNLINRGNIIVNQTQNTQNLILNQTNIMQNSQNIILNHPSPQNIVLNQNALLSRPPSVQSQKQSPLHPSPCQSPYQIFNTNATMVGSNNLSLISNFPSSSASFPTFTTSQTNCIPTKNPSPNINIVSNMSSNISSNLQQQTSKSAQSFSSNYSNPSPMSSPYNNQILSPSNSISSVTSNNLSNLKSPVQSPSPILRPTTPQPIIQQTFQQIPVMTSGPNQLVQIIHAPNNSAAYSNQLLTRQPIIAPSTSPIVKIKQPLNILPKPPSNNASTGGKNKNQNNNNMGNTQPIMLQNQTLLPTGQTGTLVLNQMPVLVQQNTPQGIQLVLRPGTPNSAQLSNQRAPQNLILQQNQVSQPTVLIQHNPRSQTLSQVTASLNDELYPQQLVRVLANGMIQPLAPTFIMNGQPLNLQQLPQQKTNSGPTTQTITQQTNPQQNINIQAQNMAALAGACIPGLNHITQQIVQTNTTNIGQQMNVTTNQQIVSSNVPISNNNSIINSSANTHQNVIVNSSGNNVIVTQHNSINTALPPPKKKPKKKKKHKETKVDLGSLMKLSGIGDEDDIYLESDTTDSVLSSSISVQTTNTVPVPAESPNNRTYVQQKPMSSPSAVHTVKTPIQSPSSNMNHQSGMNTVICGQSPVLSNQGSNLNTVLSSHSPNLNTVLSNQNPNLNTVLSNQSQTTINAVLSQSQQKTQIQTEYLQQSDIANITAHMSFPSQIGNIQISAIPDQNGGTKTTQLNIPKSMQNVLSQQPQIVVQSNSTTQNLSTQSIVQNIVQQQQQSQNFNSPVRNAMNSNLNIPTQIGNIQISQICASGANTTIQQNQNIIQNAHNLIHHAAQLQQNQQNIMQATQNVSAQQHNLISAAAAQAQNLIASQNAQNQPAQSILTQAQNAQAQNILTHNAAASAQAIHVQGNMNLSQTTGPNQASVITNSNFASLQGQNNNLTQTGNLTSQNINGPLGGFRLAMSEDGRILLQHDPTLHQDLQSQMLLQSIFGLNSLSIAQNNIVLSSNTNPPNSNIPTVVSQPIMSQPKMPDYSPKHQNEQTKTIKSIQNTIPTPKIENTSSTNGPLLFNEPLVLAPSGINGQLMLSLTTEQLEQLKNNSQFSVNGPTLVLNNPTLNQNVNTTNTIKTLNASQNRNNNNSNVLVQQLNMKSPVAKTNEIYQSNVNNLPKPMPTTPKTPKSNKKNKNAMTQPNMVMNVGVKSPKAVKTVLQEHINIKNNQITMNSMNQNITNAISNHNQNQTIENVVNQANLITNSSVQTSTAQNMSVINNTNVDNLTMPSLPTVLNQTSSSSTNTTVVPPLIAVSMAKTSDTSPAVISSSGMTGLNMPQLVPLPTSTSTGIVGTGPGMYQRVQTIQLTPQKQQQLKSVQIQIQALSALLQNKNMSQNQNENKNDQKENVMSDNEIQFALQKLFNEQQKILASGKLLPNLPAQQIFSSNCSIEPTVSQPITTSAPSKNMSTCLTNLLQQPSQLSRAQIPQQTAQNQPSAQPPAQINPSKVYYHHLGNQIIQVTPNQCQSAANQQTNTPSSIPSSVSVSIATQTSVSSHNAQHSNSFVPPNKIAPITVQTHTTDKSSQAGTQTYDSPPKFISPTNVSVSPNNGNQKQQQSVISPNSNLRSMKRSPVIRPAVPKSVLFEQQLTTDQNEAANPDIRTPFTSKADACKRLVRYHCFNQPVLSQKDLNKADEIFEMTARHFIDKFYNMINKYNSLRLMESMREVPTSELMMIDRMFIAGEQQELEKMKAEKIQQDLEGSGVDINALIKNESTDGCQKVETGEDVKKGDFKEGRPEMKDPTIKTEDVEVEIAERKVKCEPTDNTDYDEWLCIQKELGYVPEQKSGGAAVLLNASHSNSNNGSITAKTEVKLEEADEFDIESSIKTFEIRSTNAQNEGLKRGLNENSTSGDEVNNPPSKRVCTPDSRTAIGDTVKPDVQKRTPYSSSDDSIRTSNSDALGKSSVVCDNQIFSGAIDATGRNSQPKSVNINKQMNSDVNHVPDIGTVNNKISESEVFRTQQTKKCSANINVSGGSGGHTSSSSANSSHQDIDLERDLLSLDQFGLLKSNNIDTFDENIDAQVQSAIDSILNLQQSQDGSVINFHGAASSVNSAAAEQHEKNPTLFLNELLNDSPMLTNVAGAKRTAVNFTTAATSSKKKQVVSSSATAVSLMADLHHKADSDVLYDDLTNDKTVFSINKQNDVDSFSDCSSTDDALDQAVRSILS